MKSNEKHAQIGKVGIFATSNSCFISVSLESLEFYRLEMNKSLSGLSAQLVNVGRLR
jgi:hypothetical protein